MFEILEGRWLFSRTWFVATGGLDTNAGTLAAPLQTIQAAATVAQPGDVVMIEGGTYHETVTPANSGTVSAPITYEAYNNQPVVIDGADPITGWSDYNGSIYSAPQSWDLGEGNNQVFVDGQMINEARWPNTTLDVSHPAYSTSESIQNTDEATGYFYPSTATLDDPNLPGGAGAWAGATIHIASGQGWVVQTGTVLNSAAGQLTFGFEHATVYEDPASGNPYYLTGSFQALNGPGEWYRDPNTGQLYLWMPNSDDPSAHTIEAKDRQYAFELSGKSYIDVQGISIFAATIDTSATSTHITLNGITAQYVSQSMNDPFPWDAHDYGMASTGILLNGTQNVLENSTIAFSSGDGVYVSGSNNLVQNNTIHDVDYGAGDQAGIEVAGNNQQIVGNTIYNAGRDGITATYSTADQILSNTIYDCGLQTTDLGAIYVWGTNGAGTVIAGNTISAMHAGGYGACGIYLDNGSTNYIVHDNTISTTDTPIKVNGPDSNIQLYNNTTSGGSNYITPASTDISGAGAGVTDLGTLGGFRGEAQGINNSGEIVGSTLSGTGGPGFLYSGGAMSDIGTLGGNYSIAYAINSSGQFVGSAYGPSGGRQAYLDSNGVMSSLGVLPGDVGSAALALNNLGVIVGESYNSGGIASAFVWAGGTMSAIPTLGGRVSAAYGVNDAGLIVGASTLAGDQSAHAFEDLNGTVTDLGTLGGSSSYALAVNSAGTIVGESRIAGDGAVHAFVDQNGVMKDLGTLPGMPNSVATGINANGDIVGYAYNDANLATQGMTEHAFLYRNGVMYDLNTLFASIGWTLGSANGINDSDQIVGGGTNPSGFSRPFLVSVPATTATASFVHADITTQGTWTGTYGSDGYVAFDDVSHLPSYAQVSASGQSQYVWQQPTSDARALQDTSGGTTRTAACYYAAGSFSLDVNLTDGNSHQVSLYLLDWDSRGRAESVQVTDALSGVALDTQSVSNLTGGQWLTWNLSGHVCITITGTAGPNPVASGIFFDAVAPAPVAPSAPTNLAAVASVAAAKLTWTASTGAVTAYHVERSTNGGAYSEIAASVQGTTYTDSTALANTSYSYRVRAEDAGQFSGYSNVAQVTTGGATNSATLTFIKADTTTGGTWTGTYGADGYSIFNGATVLPSYAQLGVSGQQSYTWQLPSADSRALQTAPGASTRLAACDYAASAFTLDVNLTDGASHTVALYMVNFDFQNRAQTVQVTDATSGAILDTRSVSNFTGGQWLVWTITGHVKITLSDAGGLNPIASGIFFGTPTTTTTSAAASYLRTDTTTLGNWQGVYGADGYNIFDDASSMPSYASLSASGQSAYIWQKPSADSRALLDGPSFSTRTAACYYAASSFSLDLNLTDGQSHEVALYMVNFDSQNRAQTVQVTDATTGAVLDTRSLTNFASGQWLVWNITGHVKITLTNASGLNPVASGIFFGA